MEKDLTTIVEQEELDSVTGTFGFGVTTETDAKPLMSRSYTARSSQVWRKGPFTLFTQPVRNDLIHVGKELVRNEGVRFADIEQIWLNPSDRNRYGWTDSCRHEFKSGWSGMGGYCLATGVAWFYRFSEEEWVQFEAGRPVGIHQFVDDITFVGFGMLGGSRMLLVGKEQVRNDGKICRRRADMA